MATATDVYHFSVAGTSYRQRTVKTVQLGDPCNLVPEPDNQKDPNAVRVILVRTNHVLGYVPKEYCELFKEAMAAGFKFIATVGYVGPTPDDKDVLWVQLEVKSIIPQVN